MLNGSGENLCTSPSTNREPQQELLNAIDPATTSRSEKKTLTNTTAKAQLLDLLTEPLKGCKGLYTHRQNLMQRVVRMPDMEVRDHLDRLKASHFPGT